MTENKAIEKKPVIRQIEESLLVIDHELVNEIKEVMPYIYDSDLNIREIKEKHNSDFVFIHHIIGSRWTPLQALKQCYAEIRKIKRAVRVNLDRLATLNVDPTSDDIDLYSGAIRALKILGEKVKDIKKNHDLPEVIPNKMWEKDNARAMVMMAFKDGYAEAMGAGRGLAQTGYTRFAHKIGVGAMAFQWEIQEFLKKYEETPATMENEWDWVHEMGDKYKEHPFKLQRLQGYHGPS